MQASASAAEGFTSRWQADVCRFPPRGAKMRFVACPVRLADIVVHPNGIYPDKVKASGVCAPVYEVDQDGAPVAPDVSAR